MAKTPAIDWSNALTRAQLRDGAWDAVKARAEARVAFLITELCSTKLTHETAQVIRGRIAELHGLLAADRLPAAAPRRGSRLHVADSSAQDDTEDES